MGSEVRRRIDAAKAKEQAKEQKETKRSVKERRELNIFLNSMVGVLLCIGLGAIFYNSFITGQSIQGMMCFGVVVFVIMTVVSFYSAYKAYRGKKK